MRQLCVFARQAGHWPHIAQTLCVLIRKWAATFSIERFHGKTPAGWRQSKRTMLLWTLEALLSGRPVSLRNLFPSRFAWIVRSLDWRFLCEEARFCVNSLLIFFFFFWWKLCEYRCFCVTMHVSVWIRFLNPQRNLAQNTNQQTNKSLWWICFCVNINVSVWILLFLFWWCFSVNKDVSSEYWRFCVNTNVSVWIRMFMCD